MIKKKYLALVSVALILIIIYSSNPSSLVENILKIKVEVLPKLAALLIISIFLRTLKWQFVLNKTKRVSFASLLPVNLSGVLLRDTLPAKVGEPLKALLLKDIFSIPISKGIVSVVWDRLIDFIALASLTVLFLALTLGNFGSSGVLAGLGGIAIVLIACVVAVFGLIDKKVGAIVIKPFSKTLFFRRFLTVDAVDSFYSTSVGLTNVVINYILTLFSVCVEGLMFYVVLLSMGVNINPLYVVSAFSFSVICGSVSFLPAGIGSLEAVFILSLMYDGVNQSQAAACIISVRSFSILSMYLLGLLSSTVCIKKGSSLES
ncbi:MAG: lysylphosphatidylglycerol synthase transmembrane domain-containing protein [Candidatus Altiarchaeota archaeon]